ncbi:hypothetical protein [Streptomyces sp. NRRL WC-3742]|uniref:hypothetical protein n=1 Tax=Streptomyces sp. NRRL WC-3742 TaxID=1463934 RepID=UPI0004C47FAF|nr:hypothetical protein [Streptomyces sp. NRRL WC-3742]
MLLPTVPRTRAHGSATRPSVDTPFGPLTFTTTLDGTTLPPVPDALFALPGTGRTLARWTTHATTVELLLTPYDADLDPETWSPLTAAHAAVWRIETRSALARVRFTAALPRHLPDGADAYWDGGQSLAAVTVEDRHTRLSLGGDDEVVLCEAAGSTTPSHWAALIDEAYDRTNTTWGIDFGDSRHGITWRLPPLNPGDHCELPVVTAWTDADDDTENTWYAVTASSAHLLRQVATTCS